jgi:hypothetical protein
VYASFKPEQAIVRERIDRIYDVAAKGIIAAAKDALTYCAHPPRE